MQYVWLATLLMAALRVANTILYFILYTLYLKVYT